jgi:hypothetical protein
MFLFQTKNILGICALMFFLLAVQFEPCLSYRFEPSVELKNAWWVYALRKPTLKAAMRQY